MYLMQCMISFISLQLKGSVGKRDNSYFSNIEEINFKVHDCVEQFPYVGN